MTRKGFVGLAGVIVVAAVLGQALVIAQNSAAPKAPAKSDQNAPAKSQTPPATKANPDMKTTPKAEAGGGGAVPATTPTQQPTQGPAEEPKVTATSIGSVTIPKKVMADGKPLAAGTYMLRLTDQTAPPVTGQTVSEERWVEFLQGGQVKGREIATVLTNTEAKTIAKQGVHSGGAKIQTLIGNEYLRVWINKGGTNYLVHLPNG